MMKADLPLRWPRMSRTNPEETQAFHDVQAAVQTILSALDPPPNEQD